jgi:hypothetical protein
MNSMFDFAEAAKDFATYLNESERAKKHEQRILD